VRFIEGFGLAVFLMFVGLEMLCPRQLANQVLRLMNQYREVLRADPVILILKPECQ